MLGASWIRTAAEALQEAEPAAERVCLGVSREYGNYAYIYICVCVYICVYVYTDIYIYICICMCVHIYRRVLGFRVSRGLGNILGLYNDDGKESGNY